MAKPKKPRHNPDTPALYALGALTSAEAVAFEAHLGVCEECSRASARFNDVVDLTKDRATSILPAHLREQLLSRLQQHRSNRTRTKIPVGKLAGLSDLETVRKNQRKWTETPYEGIWICKLFEDAPQGHGAILVKMSAGAIYPDHQHMGREQFYVIEGDVKVGTDTLHAGDYHRAEGRTYHRQVSTDNGCMCIIFGYVGSISAKT